MRKNYEKGIRRLLKDGVKPYNMICYVSKTYAKKQLGYSKNADAVLKIEIDNKKIEVDTVMVNKKKLNGLKMVLMEKGSNIKDGIKKFVEYVEIK